MAVRNRPIVAGGVGGVQRGGDGAAGYGVLLDANSVHNHVVGSTWIGVATPALDLGHDNRWKARDAPRDAVRRGGVAPASAARTTCARRAGAMARAAPAQPVSPPPPVPGRPGPAGSIALSPLAGACPDPPVPAGDGAHPAAAQAPARTAAAAATGASPCAPCPPDRPHPGGRRTCEPAAEHGNRSQATHLPRPRDPPGADRAGPTGRETVRGRTIRDRNDRPSGSGS